MNLTSNRRFFVAFTPALLAVALALITWTRAADRAKPAPGENAPPDYVSKRIAVLRDRLSELTGEVLEKEHHLDLLRKNLGIVGPAPNEDALPLGENVAALEHERQRVLQDYIQLNGLFEALKQKKGIELRNAIPVAYPDEP